MTRTRVACLMLVAMSAGSDGSVWAQERKDLYNKGRAAYDAGDCVDALKNLFAYREVNRTLYAQGGAGWGSVDEAIESCEQSLRVPTPATSGGSGGVMVVPGGSGGSAGVMSEGEDYLVIPLSGLAARKKVPAEEFLREAVENSPQKQELSQALERARKLIGPPP